MYLLSNFPVHHHTTGWIAYGGLDVKVVDHWHADLLVRHMGLDVDGTHYHGDTATSSFSIPLSNDAVSLGARYDF